MYIYMSLMVCLSCEVSKEEESCGAGDELMMSRQEVSLSTTLTYINTKSKSTLWSQAIYINVEGFPPPFLCTIFDLSRTFYLPTLPHKSYQHLSQFSASCSWLSI